MIIATAGQKGGSGKTTVAFNVADELFRRGHTTLLIDADPQASSSRTLACRGDENGPDIVANPGLLKGDNWRVARDQLSHLRAKYAHIVIDPPPQNLSPQRILLANVDFAILPCGPTAFDLWSLADVFNLVRDYREARGNDFRAKILLNRVRARTRLSREAAEAVEESHVPVFDTRLSHLVDYGESPSAGVGVTRYAPNGKAAQEVRHLVDELLAR